MLGATATQDESAKHRATHDVRGTPERPPRLARVEITRLGVRNPVKARLDLRLLLDLVRALGQSISHRALKKLTQHRMR
jgi:hypothetical protein